MIIHVTKDDILCGIQKDPYHCPISVALENMGFKLPSVSFIGIHFIKEPDGYAFFDTPKIVMKFIHDFDNNNSVSPFEFYLDFQ